MDRRRYIKNLSAVRSLDNIVIPNVEISEGHKNAILEARNDLLREGN